MFWIDDVYVTGVLREAAEKSFSFTPKTKNISDEAKYDFEQLEQLCKNRSFDLKMKWKPLILVHYGLALYHQYMNCFWEKTLYDREKLFGKSYLEWIDLRILQSELHR